MVTRNSCVTLLQNNMKFLHVITNFPRSSGVSELVSEQTNGRIGAYQQSKKCRASEWVTSASGQVNERGRASGLILVILSWFLVVLNHSAYQERVSQGRPGWRRRRWERRRCKSRDPAPSSLLLFTYTKERSSLVHLFICSWSLFGQCSFVCLSVFTFPVSYRFSSIVVFDHECRSWVHIVW